MTDTNTIERANVTKLTMPNKWAIILHNDDVTPMDFVIELLAKVFKYNAARAMELMITIHTAKSGVAGVYQFEIAQHKHDTAIEFIRAAGMQLKVTLEEVE